MLCSISLFASTHSSSFLTDVRIISVHLCFVHLCAAEQCVCLCCCAYASLCCGAYAAACTPSFVSMRLPSQWKTRIAHADRGRGEDGWREGGSSRRSCLLHSQLASAPERACFRAFERAFSSLSPAASTLFLFYILNNDSVVLLPHNSVQKLKV